MPAMIHVLLVDGELLMRLAIVQALADEGCVVLEAVDAAAARTILLTVSHPVDVVILDCRLPEGRDLDLLVLVKRQSPGSQVILMTTHPTPDLVERAYRHGVAAVLHKPIDLDHLCRRVVALAA